MYPDPVALTGRHRELLAIDSFCIYLCVLHTSGVVGVFLQIRVYPPMSSVLPPLEKFFQNDFPPLTLEKSEALTPGSMHKILEASDSGRRCC